MPLPDVEDLRARGVRLVAGSITDLAGVTRAKYVPLSRLEAFQRAGMGVSPSWSVFCVDSGIAFTPNIGVDGDLRIRIDPADLRLVTDGIAWAPGDLTHQQGGAADLCTRSLLKRIESDLSAKGLTAMIGAELECTMLSADAGHATTEPWSPYSVRTSLDRSAFLVDLAEAAEGAGLPVEQIHTEYGHDQLEVSLAPSTPVAAVDTVAAARIVIGRAAARHGLRISFSPFRSQGRRATARTCTFRWPTPKGRCSPAETGRTACGRRAGRRSPGCCRHCRTFSAFTRVRCCRRHG